MYKDKDKQKEANAERQRRYKAKQKALLNEGVTYENGGVTVPDKLGPNDKAHRQRTQLVKPGHCWCCGNEIEPILVCCGPCAWSGRAKAKRAGAAPPRIGDEPELHPSIVAGINRLTTNPDGTVDEQARTTRMANAMHYEQVCPGRPYTGVGISTDDTLSAEPDTGYQQDYEIRAHE
ncbi:hypothetical protein LCGC14_0345960 [marine sediment metagenome]|uniref:Uncharacterized protein n=1 Tax=marine sediment metagenome TaxID=412755 RepID=A0A0F9THW5_9ZZZZ